MSFITSLGDWLRKITTSFASASISGQNITLTRHNGDTVVLTTYAPSYSIATQSTDGFMSAQDKTTFDAIPDTYVIKQAELNVNNAIKRTASSGYSCYALFGTQTGNNSEIADFGWDYSCSEGAGIGFRSAAHPTDSGAFLIYARNTTHASDLAGYPDGRLYWNGAKIPTLADLASSSQAGVMSASDKAKLDGLVAYSGATTTSSGLVTTGDQTWAGAKTIANSSDTGWHITYGSGSSLQTMRFEIGSNHVNRGIWDNRLNKWVFHCDNSKCYVGGYSIEKSVPSNAKFTDTVTTVSTSGSGNAVTDITANNGKLSVTKGTSFFPLNGGALTGTDIWRSEGNSRLFLSGGNAWNTGSQLWLKSKEVGDGITLTAMGNNGGTKSLFIKPDGTLSWDGKDISRLLTNTQSTGSRTSAVGSAAQLNYTIANNVVWLWIYVVLTRQAAGWSDTKICTNLPTPASRNHGNMCGAAVQYDGNYGNPAYFVINDSGELHLINRGTVIAANTAVWGFLSYPRGY